MASEVSICNRALSHLGGEVITSLSEDILSARLCNTFYADLRDELLELHPWNFARKRAELAQLSTAPTFGFTYAYQLPSDFINLYRIWDSTTTARDPADVPYELEDNKLLFDWSSCKVIYIRRVTDVTKFSQAFISTLAARIAAQIAWKLTGNRQKEQFAWSLYASMLAQARGVNAQQQYPEAFDASSWTDARQIGPVS